MVRPLVARAKGPSFDSPIAQQVQRLISQAFSKARHSLVLEFERIYEIDSVQISVVACRMSDVYLYLLPVLYRLISVVACRMSDVYLYLLPVLYRLNSKGLRKTSD